MINELGVEVIVARPMISSVRVCPCNTLYGGGAWTIKKKKNEKL